MNGDKMISDVRSPTDGAHNVRGSRTWLAVAAGAIGGLAAASCCVLPLVLFALGISGAWIGNLTALAPYQPLFVAFAAAALVYGFVLAYRTPQIQCVDGSYCSRPSSTRLLKVALWVATLLVISAVGFPYVAALLLT